MEWRTRSRKGRVAAGPRVPRRERRPPRHLRRASTSNAGAHARRPQTLTMCHGRRATTELGQQEMRTPTAGRPCIMIGTGRSGGTLSPGRPGLCPCQPEAACARGPWQERPRPQEQDRRACGTERVISPAPLSGALRGVPARRGRRRRHRLRRRGRPSPETALHVRHGRGDADRRPGRLMTAGWVRAARQDEAASLPRDFPVQVNQPRPRLHYVMPEGVARPGTIIIGAAG